MARHLRRGDRQCARGAGLGVRADGDTALGIALTAAAVPLWVRLSLFAECRERARTALAALGDTGDDRVRMQLLSALGWSLMYGEGRAREARPILETTLELADRLDDKDFRLRALWGLCIDQFNNGRVRQGARASPIVSRTRRRTRPTGPTPCWPTG